MDSASKHFCYFKILIIWATFGLAISVLWSILYNKPQVVSKAQKWYHHPLPSFWLLKSPNFFMTFNIRMYVRWCICRFELLVTLPFQIDNPTLFLTHPQVMDMMCRLFTQTDGRGIINVLQYRKNMSELIKPKWAIFPPISWEDVILWWDDDDICFVLNQHTV